MQVSERPAGRTVRIAAVALLVLVGGGFLFLRLRGSAAEPKEHGQTPGPGSIAAPELVRVEQLVPGTLMRPVRVTGTLRTDESVTISTKATGVVKRVTVREGDRVTRGQFLVEIDDSDIRAQRDRAVAQVEAARAAEREAEQALTYAEARLAQARTSRDMRNAAAESEHSRAQDGLLTARSRLSQARSLSQIADTEAETRVATARAGLQSSKERLRALMDGARRQEKAAAEAGVARARANAERFKSVMERREQLLRDKAIAVEAVDNARRDYQVALAELESAQQQLSLVKEGPRTEEIRVGEESVRQAEAALRDAEANRARRAVSSEEIQAAEAAVRQAASLVDSTKAGLAQARWNEDEIRTAEAGVAQARAGRRRAAALTDQARADVRFQDQLIGQTRIYSPVSGVVTSRSVQVGAAVVQMRNELMTLVSSDTLYFEARAPELALPYLRTGMPARVILDAVPGKVLTGTLRQIIPVAEGTSRAVRLRISVPRSVQGAAVVGGFARAEIRGASAGATLTVPRAALVSDEGEGFVFVVEGVKARRRNVTVDDGGGTGERVEVLSGVKAGDVVVIDGAGRLVDGREVTVENRP